jgi:aminotransferase
MNNIPFSGIRLVFEEVARLEAAGEEIVHFELGRPDFDTPRHIREAAKKALDDGLVHYTSNYGLADLREAICEKLARQNNIRAASESEIIVTAGANEAVFLAFAAFLDPGDEVLIPDPAWPHYFHCARLVGALPVSVPLRQDNGFQLDPRDLVNRIGPRSKMVILNSPHNPTGTVTTADVVEEVCQVVLQHGLILLSDEIYERIVYDGCQVCSPASLDGVAEHIITVNGLSKAYSMTGWRLGYVVATRRAVEAMIRVHQYTTICATSFAQQGGVAALRGNQDCIAGMVTEFDRRRRHVLKRLRRVPGVSLVEPKGGFYVFPDLSSLGLRTEDICSRLLREAKVAVVPGNAFGEHGEGFIRIAYSCGFEQVQRGMNALDKALTELSQH